MEDLIKEYEFLISCCQEELTQDYITANLEAYIKGKKSAYERIVESLKTLKI
jgi:hypothetical protein